MALAAHAAVWVSVPAAVRIATAVRRSPQEALQLKEQRHCHFASLLSFLLGGFCMTLAAHAAVWLSVPAAARIAVAARRSPQEALQVAIRAAGAAALVVAAVPVVGLGINYSALLAFFHMHLAPLPASLAAQKRRGLSASAASAATAGSALASAALKPTDLPALLVCFCFGAAVVSLFYHLPPSIFSRSLALGHKLISRMDRSASEAAGGGANVVAVADMVGLVRSLLLLTSLSISPCINLPTSLLSSALSPPPSYHSPCVRGGQVGVGMARGAARACEAFCLAAAEAVASMVLGAHVAQHCAIDNPTGFILLPLVVLSLDLLTSAAAILSVSAAAGSSRLPHSLPVDSSSSSYSSSSPFSSHSPLFRSSPRSPMLRGSVLPTAAEEVVGCIFNGYALSLVLAVSSFALATRWLLFTEQAPLAWLHFFFCALLGMLSSILLLLSSSLLSAPHLPPVRSLAIASSSGHASNISSGLALGIAAAAPPAVIVGLAVAAAVWLGRNSGLVDGKGEPAGGLLGLAVAVMGMLSSGCFSLTTDLFQLAVSHAGLLCKMMAQHQKQQQQGQMQQMQEFSLGPAAHDVMQDAHGMAAHGMDAYGMGMQDGGGMASDHMGAAGSPHVLQQQVSSDAVAAAAAATTGGVGTGEMAAEDSSSSLQSSSLQSSALPPHAPTSSAAASPAAAAAATAAAVLRTPVSPLEAAASAVASATRGMGCGASSLCSLLLVHAFVALVSSYSSTALQNIDLLRPELLVACMVGAAVVVGGVAMAGGGVTRCTAIVVREGRRHLHHRAEEKQAYPRAPMVLDDPSRFVGAVAAVSLKELLLPGLLAVAAPIAMGMIDVGQRRHHSVVIRQSHPPAPPGSTGSGSTASSRCAGDTAVNCFYYLTCLSSTFTPPSPHRHHSVVSRQSHPPAPPGSAGSGSTASSRCAGDTAVNCFYYLTCLSSTFTPPSPHRHHSAVSRQGHPPAPVGSKGGGGAAAGGTAGDTAAGSTLQRGWQCVEGRQRRGGSRTAGGGAGNPAACTLPLHLPYLSLSLLSPLPSSHPLSLTGIIVRSVGKATQQPLLGARAVAALLLVAVLVTLLLAALFNGAGSAWRGARDVVEAGHLGGPGSEAHKATITGDTVGGTLRETLAPTLHILLNLLSTAALAAAPLFFEH
ncbi:unnamed protein product [Closterium sp. NIES-54]